MPSSLAARKARMAISPRLATRTFFSIVASFYRPSGLFSSPPALPLRQEIAPDPQNIVSRHQNLIHVACSPVEQATTKRGSNGTQGLRYVPKAIVSGEAEANHARENDHDPDSAGQDGAGGKHRPGLRSAPRQGTAGVQEFGRFDGPRERRAHLYLPVGNERGPGGGREQRLLRGAAR